MGQEDKGIRNWEDCWFDFNNLINVKFGYEVHLYRQI